MGNLESLKKSKFGSIVLLPIAFVLGVLGLGSPVFFSTVSEETLIDVGEGSKTIDQEIIRQLRQNNLGPAEMLLPLTSPPKRKEFGRAIDKKKEDHPELYKTLQLWQAETGCPMLLNTSLNIKGKPMVNDEADAEAFAKHYGVKVV